MLKWKQKEIEKEQLRTLLLRNNYPVHVINKEFETFEKNKTFVNLEKQTETELKTKYLSLPNINDKSEKIAFKLKNIVKEFFVKTNLRVAFKSPAQLGDHFPFKDKITDPKKLSNVIYHSNCKSCSEN